MSDYMSLPADLPAPEDDGAADHLPGAAMPHLELPSTAGREVALDRLGPGRTVLYIYPMTGQPGVDLPEGWNSIPGARGCTPETCGFRDHHAELKAAGAGTVFGLSSQSTDYQAELAERLGLPFEILSDTGHELGGALDLPTFTAGDQRLYKRLTLVIADGRIEHVFYPIFPPDEHAAEVLAWLSSHA
jgi:peroxiredoxin